jgi:hypothetical protein
MKELSGRHSDICRKLKWSSAVERSSLGTHLFKDQINWLSQTAGILLLLDGDPVGRDASARIAHFIANVMPIITDREGTDLPVLLTLLSALSSALFIAYGVSGVTGEAVPISVNIFGAAAVAYGISSFVLLLLAWPRPSAVLVRTAKFSRLHS